MLNTFINQLQNLDIEYLGLEYYKSNDGRYKSIAIQLLNNNIYKLNYCYDFELDKFIKELNKHDKIHKYEALKTLNNKGIKFNIYDSFAYTKKTIKVTKKSKYMALAYFDYRGPDNNLLMLKVFEARKNKPTDVRGLLNYGVYDNTILFDYDYIKNVNSPRSIKKIAKWLKFEAKSVLNVIDSANETLQ